MSQTIPDVILNDGEFTDINTATGIAVGTRVIVQFKSNYSALVQLATAQPDADSQDGNLLMHGQYYEMGDGDPTIWVKGNGRISVQVA